MHHIPGRKVNDRRNVNKGYVANVTNVIAHRGASRAEPENTVAAFRRAAAMGADGVELDVRRTADGELVIHHDAHLGDGRVIVGTPRRELAALASFGDALDACAGMFVNIEIKNDPDDPDFDPDDAVAVAVLEALAGRPEPAEHWLISCFRAETVARCRALAPEVPTAWLTTSCSADDVARTAAAGHAAIHPWEPALTEAAIAAAHDAGLRVNTWTCNDPARAVELARWGIDGICTDVPDVLLAALRHGD